MLASFVSSLTEARKTFTRPTTEKMLHAEHVTVGTPIRVLTGVHEGKTGVVTDTAPDYFRRIQVEICPWYKNDKREKRRYPVGCLERLEISMTTPSPEEITSGRIASDVAKLTEELLEWKRKAHVLDYRVYELEEAIGAAAPLVCRCLLDLLPADADVDRELTQGVLDRLEKVMETSTWVEKKVALENKSGTGVKFKAFAAYHAAQKQKKEWDLQTLHKWSPDLHKVVVRFKDKETSIEAAYAMFELGSGEMVSRECFDVVRVERDE